MLQVCHAPRERVTILKLAVDTRAEAAFEQVHAHIVTKIQWRKAVASIATIGRMFSHHTRLRTSFIASSSRATRYSIRNLSSGK